MTSKDFSNRPAGQRTKLRPARLNRDQIALIHTARRQCQLEEDSYRQMLMEVAGVDSSSELTAAGFTAVMVRFKLIGFVHRPKAGAGTSRVLAPKFGPRPGMATDAQLSKISAKWEEWSGRADGSGLNAWLERSFGVSNVRFLNSQLAGMAIEGLKRMAGRKAAGVSPAHGGHGAGAVD